MVKNELLSRRRFICMLAAGAVSCSANVMAQDSVLKAMLKLNQDMSWQPSFDVDNPTLVAFRGDKPLLSDYTLKLTKSAARSLRTTIDEYGGWPLVPFFRTLRLGTTSSAVITLRKRLSLSGDLVEQRGHEYVFDSFVKAAIKKFQFRHGFAVTGKITSGLLQEMNVSAENRFKQLGTNIKRLNRLQNHFELRRHVVVNIPDAYMEVVENGAIVARHKVVVGSPNRQTPSLSSEIYEINFYPYWYIPTSIVLREILPQVRISTDYLKDKHIRIFDVNWKEVTPDEIDWTGKQALKYKLRQEPGPTNAMATVKITFKNKYSVYMHDTPFKDWFGSEERFRTAGCMRIQNISSLVKWLLKDTEDWGSDRIEEVLRSKKRINVKLSSPIPVHTCYITAWASVDGVVNFRKDVYYLD